MSFQLTLGLKFGVKTTLDNFIVGDNQSVLERLKYSLQSRSPVLIHLWGEEGIGKTHLLQAACQSLVYQGFQAGYIDLKPLNNFDILNGLHQLKLVCFDNLHSIQDDQHIARLSEFITASLDQGHQILTSSRDALSTPILTEIPCLLQYQLKALSEQDMRLALKQKAEERGLFLPVDLEDIVLNKVGNSMKSMMNVLDTLENSCDQEKKKTKLFKTTVKSMINNLL
ncbi:hypothetical protein EBR43_00575 [bacterium]|nr:hypothetical protein [bacterium]NBW56283.1 hypothetical protein [bacterium]NBX72389.1 hypothetical protein [bacterium]